MLTPELRNAAATLLMGVIKADQTIKQEEIDAAYDALNELSAEASDDGWRKGDNAILGRTSGSRIADAMGALRFAPEEDRLDLLSTLWDVAMSDGEIHEMEEAFVESAAQALDLPQSLVHIVRPASVSIAVEQRATA